MDTSTLQSLEIENLSPSDTTPTSGYTDGQEIRRHSVEEDHWPVITYADVQRFRARMGIAPRSDTLDQTDEVSEASSEAEQDFLESFITINPQTDVEFEDFKQRIEQCLKWKCIKNAVYTYEVRKEDLSGFHCHLMIRHDCTRKSLKTQLVRLFITRAHMCLTPRHIDFKHAIKMSKKKFWNDHIDYIKGITFLDNYDTKVFDEKFRENFKLEPFYEI